MKKLPLYRPDEINSALGREEPLSVTKECKRCELHEGVRTVCMPADGEPGGVLFVSEYPGKNEDDVGRPMVGASGRYFRSLLARWGVKKFAIDNALKCAPGRQKKIKSKWVKACRPYAADVVREVNPARIICLGGTSIEGVLGRRFPVLSARKGWAWHRREDGELIPVFFTVNPAAAARNRFVRAAFEEDLKWALFAEPPKPNFDAIAYLVETVADAKLAAKRIHEYPWQSYDVETSGEMHNGEFKIECTSFASPGRKAVWVWTRKAMSDPAARAIAKTILESRTVGVVAQNGKYDDRSVLLDLKADVQNLRSDTRLMSRMLDPAASASLDVIAERIGLGGHKLEAKAANDKILRELGRQAKPPKLLTPKGNKRKIKPPLFHVPSNVLDRLRKGANPKAYMYAFLDDETLYRYNARDADVTRQYNARVEEEFNANPDIRRMWEEVVRDANKAVRWIEHWGFMTDRAAVTAFATYCQMQIADAREGLEKYGKFNPNAPKQVAEILFHKLRLPVLKLTDSQAESTDKDVLEQLRGKHPIIDHLLAFRKYSKLDSTYASGMLPFIRDDGRVHSSFLLDGAGTGRMSSAEPNMQNIPRAKGSPDAKMARNCFIVPPDHVLLESDFSQLELRIAAMMSGDLAMIDDFKNGIDIHLNAATECCELAWGIKRSKWDAMLRDRAADPKCPNAEIIDAKRSEIKTGYVFGKLYGKTARGIAAEYNTKLDVVEKINQKIWGRYKNLDRWTQQKLSESRKTGDAWTWWNGHRGYRRPLWGIGDPEDGVRENAERSSWNTPIQGTAATFCTASLWPIIEWIRDDCVPAKVVGTVHDSILVEVHKDALRETARQVKRIMEGHYVEHGVPIVVDQKVGPSWGSLTDLKL